MRSYCEFSDIFQLFHSRYNAILIVIFMALINQVFQTESIHFSKVKAFGFQPYPRVKSISYTPYSYHKLKSKDKVSTHGPTRNTEISRKHHDDIKNPKISVNENGYEAKPPKKEVDSTLDDLLEVLGPHLFLIPFVLKVLPFAIPALPLSYILSRYEPASIPELIMQIMEYSTQINELLFTQQESNNAAGSPEG